MLPHIATIDAVRAAPPPSPLAPIDLLDEVSIAEAMDVAARIGDLLLSSGTSNKDTIAQIRAVTSAYGLVHTQVDITLNTITLFHHIAEESAPLTVFRVVGRMSTDFSKLSAVDLLIRSIQAGATPPRAAGKLLDEITLTPTSYGTKISLLGWAGLAAATAIMVGGAALGAVVAAVVAAAITVMNNRLELRGLPLFFRALLSGVVTTVAAAALYSLTGISPSHVIAAVIIVMLARLSLVQSLQDGITGAPVTASARFFETTLMTGAIIAGVGAGIEISALLGHNLPPLESFLHSPTRGLAEPVIACAIASACFALACYAPWRSVMVSGLTAACGAIAYHLILTVEGLSVIVATTAAAVVVGLFGGLLARRFLIPPLITGIAGITPLLPGMAMYRGMYAGLNEQILLGMGSIALALSVAGALAAGSVFGEWVARRLRRPPRMSFYTALWRGGEENA